MFCGVLLQIVERYDILLIQEIRDKSETSIDILVDAVNADIGLVLTSNFTLTVSLSPASIIIVYINVNGVWSANIWKLFSSLRLQLNPTKSEFIWYSSRVSPETDLA